MIISHDENGNAGVCFSVNYRQVELYVFVLTDIQRRGYISHDSTICGWFGVGERYPTLEEAVIAMGEAIMKSLCYN